MNFSKIKALIEQYRVLTGLSSLPFIADIHGRATICWFNYFLDQRVDNLSIAINDVFTLTEEGMIKGHGLSGTIQVSLNEFDEPQMQEKEYLIEVEKIYTNFSCTKMAKLLHTAEILPLLPAYKKAVELLKESEE